MKIKHCECCKHYRRLRRQRQKRFLKSQKAKGICASCSNKVYGKLLCYEHTLKRRAYKRKSRWMKKIAEGKCSEQYGMRKISGVNLLMGVL